MAASLTGRLHRPTKRKLPKKIKTFCTISLLVIRASGVKRSLVNLIIRFGKGHLPELKTRVCGNPPFRAHKRQYLR
jgi:hypothetical protein